MRRMGAKPPVPSHIALANARPLGRVASSPCGRDELLGKVFGMFSRQTESSYLAPNG